MVVVVPFVVFDIVVVLDDGFVGAGFALLIDKIKELEDPEQKRALIVLTANHMKKSFLTWNKDSVEDQQIYNDMLDMMAKWSHSL